MNIKTAVVAGFILNAGLGGAVFAQGYYPPQSRGYATSNQRQAERIVRQAGALPIAHDLGVPTRERVRQLRDRALKRLREGDVGRALGSFAA